MNKTLIAVALILVVAGIVLWSLSAQDVWPAAADSCLSISSCALQEFRNDWNYYRSSTIYNATGSASYYVPVNLPHGATIRKLMLICIDNHDGEDIAVALYRQNRAVEGSRIADLMSDGYDSDYRIFTTTDVSPKYVNNFKNCYFLQVTLPGSDVDGFKLAQVKIFYDIP